MAILSDKTMAMKMGEKGRKHVEEKFSWPATIDRVIRLYEEVLENGYPESFRSGILE